MSILSIGQFQGIICFSTAMGRTVHALWLSGTAPEHIGNTSSGHRVGTLTDTRGPGGPPRETEHGRPGRGR